MYYNNFEKRTNGKTEAPYLKKEHICLQEKKKSQMSSGMHSRRWCDTPATDLQIVPVIAIVLVKYTRIIVGIGKQE